jgi:hypothetical protein
MQSVQGSAEFDDAIMCRVGTVFGVSSGFCVCLFACGEFSGQLGGLPSQTSQSGLQGLVVAVGQIGCRFAGVSGRRTPACTIGATAVGLALGGDGVGEVNIAGVDGGTQEARASVVGADGVAVDVGVGRQLIVRVGGADGSGLRGVSGPRTCLGYEDSGKEVAEMILTGAVEPPSVRSGVS